MNYKSVLDSSHQGFDISVYEVEQDNYTVDVKKPCGELLNGWTLVSSYEEAMAKAINYINELTGAQ
jgi:hypothetical protein